MIGEALIWAAVTLGVWLLTLSSVTAADLMVAMPCAVVCGAIAVVVRRSYGVYLAYPRRAWSWSAKLPLILVTDTVRTLALAPLRAVRRRRDEGTFVRVAVAPGPDRGPVTQRAAAIVLVSATPGTYALHDDSDTGEIVVHGLLDGGPSMHTVVTR